MRFLSGRGKEPASSPTAEHKQPPQGQRTTQAVSWGRRVMTRLRGTENRGAGPTAQRAPSVTAPERRRSSDSGAGPVPEPLVPSGELSANEISDSAYLELPDLPDPIPGAWDPRHDLLREQANRITLDQRYLLTVSKGDPEHQEEILRIEWQIGQRLSAMDGFIRAIGRSPKYKAHPLLTGPGEQAAELRNAVGDLYALRVYRTLYSQALATAHDDDDEREALDDLREAEGKLRAVGIDPKLV